MKRERIGGIALLCLGIMTVGTGAYFLFFRPALLPEDMRFTGADPRLLDPRMAAWLRIVFRTWGGFLTGFGILLAAVAGICFRRVKASSAGEPPRLSSWRLVDSW